MIWDIGYVNASAEPQSLLMEEAFRKVSPCLAVV